MSDQKAPVLFIIFNRYDCSKQVFEAIKRYQPNKLYIAADGPRKGITDDTEKCNRVRAMVSEVTWPCEVIKLFREENLGCKLAVSGAISWFFEQEEEGIILEDDCLPHDSFFPYCAQLLEKYRHDERVMHITGTNLQFGRQRGNASYYFSSISAVWGWAGWRRVWKNFDLDMKLFPAFEKEGNPMKNVFFNERTASFAFSVNKSTYERKIETWDFPYAFSVIINNGLCIAPNKNLISNIGFQSDSTNTKNSRDVHANIPVEDIGPLKHPVFFIPDREADQFQLSLSMPAAPASPASEGKFFSKVKKIFNN